jgi:hypothetical protein
MKTPKTKGDILAERIEAIKHDFDGLQGLSEILGEALAEYRAPEWTLGRSVNGHTLRDGQEWHRQDWTKDMLPDGWRPLLKGEMRHPSDQIYGTFGTGPWVEYANSDTAYASAESGAIRSRTRRPLPILTLEQIADGWVEWHGGECPVFLDSSPTIMFRNGKIPCDDTADSWNWMHEGEYDDIIAYRPDPYEALKKAHSEGMMIQVKSITAGDVVHWDDASPSWTRPVDHYRIKPSPAMVPLGPEDVKCGDEIKSSEFNSNRFAIMEITPHGVYSRRTFHTWGELQEFCVINRNDGKGFVRCEKEAE